jgi:hypothetical protein
VECRWLLDPWLGFGRPLATLGGSVAGAVCSGDYRPGLVAAALDSRARNPLQGGLPMVFDLSPGDVVRIGDGVTLTVLAIEDGLIRFGVESPEECPAAGVGCEGADLKPEQGGWGLNYPLAVRSGGARLPATEEGSPSGPA